MSRGRVRRPPWRPSSRSRLTAGWCEHHLVQAGRRTRLAEAGDRVRAGLPGGPGPGECGRGRGVRVEQPVAAEGVALSSTQRESMENLGSGVVSADDFQSDQPFVLSKIQVQGQYAGVPADINHLVFCLVEDKGGTPGWDTGWGLRLGSTGRPGDPAQLGRLECRRRSRPDAGGREVVDARGQYWLSVFADTVLGAAQFYWRASGASNLNNAQRGDWSNPSEGPPVWTVGWLKSQPDPGAGLPAGGRDARRPAVLSEDRRAGRCPRARTRAPTSPSPSTRPIRSGPRGGSHRHQQRPGRWTGGGAGGNVLLLRAEADFSWSPPNPMEGEEVTFTATSEDGNLTYAWDFGDGTTGAGDVAAHTFTVAGDYPVTLSGTSLSCRWPTSRRP